MTLGPPGAARVRWKLLGIPLDDHTGRHPAGTPVLPGRAARPPRTSAGGCGPSGAPRRAMDRRDADLRARADRARPARARGMTEASAMRVLRHGGGGRPARGARREPGLAQGRELEGRVDGVTHPLAERALVRATAGHRREHVFETVGGPSDGSGAAGAAVPLVRMRFGSGTRVGRGHRLQRMLRGSRAVSATAFSRSQQRRLAVRSGVALAACILLAGTTVLYVQRRLFERRRLRRRARETRHPHPRGRDRAQRPPNDAHTSTLVRTFSITASVNSVVVAWPPRSTVLTPVAVVSNTPS